MTSAGISAPGDIMRLAQMLRTHVNETNDARYASLFQQTADALENRAGELATPSTSSGKVDIVC